MITAIVNVGGKITRIAGSISDGISGVLSRVRTPFDSVCVEVITLYAPSLHVANRGLDHVNDVDFGEIPRGSLRLVSVRSKKMIRQSAFPFWFSKTNWETTYEFSSPERFFECPHFDFDSLLDPTDGPDEVSP